MRFIECIRFRSCSPAGKMLAKDLMVHFSAEARSQGVRMTVWLDEALAGDLCVHLEHEGPLEHNRPKSSIGISIERYLGDHGLITRRLLTSAP